MIGRMQQPASRGRPSPAGAARSPYREQPADDWLGDVADYDWSENAAEHSERNQAAPAREGLVADVGEADGRLPEPATASGARRAAVERRRIVAGLGVAALLGVVIVVALLLLRGGPKTPASEAGTTTPSVTTTTPPTTPSTTPSTTTETPATQAPETTPSQTPSANGSTFTLPEGTKLRLGEGDPALVKQLQQALVAAGYDPGSVDGSFGPTTEAAVTAFQQDNGLSADGVVGPDTAAALNSAVSSG